MAAAKILKGNPKYMGAQGHAHFSSGCGFMVGLGKSKLCIKFDMHCVNTEVEPPHIWELP